MEITLAGLDLVPYCTAREGLDLLYDCRAVIQHHGDFIDTGHYTALIKGLDGRWGGAHLGS